MKFRFRLLFVLALPVALAACAPPMSETVAVGDTAAVDDAADVERVRLALARYMPGVTFDAVRPTPVPEVFEVQVGMNFGYVSADGRYLLSGNLVDLKTEEELTEVHRRGARLALLEQIDPKDTIEFVSQEPPRYTVTVFTDIDCGYCRRLHSQMAQYNAEGIAIRYLFYPRSGPRTESFYKAEEVWCSADRQAALTEAKLGHELKASRDCDNPVAAHYQASQSLGLSGTPTLILPNGEMVPGYVPPATLLQQLEGMPSSAG